MPGFLPSVLLGFGQDLINGWLGEQGNKRQEEKVYQANDLLEQSKQESVDALQPYRDPNWLKNNINMPGFSFQGQKLGDGGINIDDFWKNGKSAADAFAAHSGDWKNYIDNGMVDPNRAAADVGHLYDQAPVDTRAYLANELQKAGAASRGREQQARSGMLQQGLSRGMSLEDMSGDLSNLAMSEAQARGAQATSAGAAGQRMINEANLKKADSQAGTYNTFGGYNKDLAASGAQAALDSAKYGADFTAQDISEEDKRKEAAWNSWSDWADKYAQRDKDSATMSLSIAQELQGWRNNLTGQQSANLVGLQYAVPQTSAISSALQNQAQIDAAKASRPKSSFSFGLGPLSIGGAA